LENKNVVLTKNLDNLYFYEAKTKSSTHPDIIELTLIDETEEELVINLTVYKKGEVFMGDFPLMTDAGTFIINGSQKVIVSQLVRSPGAYFNKELNRKNGEMIYSANIIPSRGT